MNFRTHRHLVQNAADYVKQTRERFVIAQKHNVAEHHLTMYAYAVERAVNAQKELRSTKLSDMA